MFLRLGVFLQLSLMGFATSIFATEGITAVGNQLQAAGNLLKNNEHGSAFILVKYVIIFLGMIIMGMGINDTFVAEDRGGENKKMTGVMKMIGGALFVAIISIVGLFNNTLH